MSTLSDLLAAHTDLTGAAVAHLQRVVGEWQLLADLSFADFVLWVPVAGGGFRCVAQCRPTTAPTAHPEDLVGAAAAPDQRAQLDRARREAVVRGEDEPRRVAGRPVRREVVPVGHEGRIVAVLARDTNLSSPRVPSTLEVAYQAVADDLCRMLVDGTFPTAAGHDEGPLSPRVGDGLVRVDAAGTVRFVSPNAASAFHRLGRTDDLVGADLLTVARTLPADPFGADELVASLRAALDGHPSSRAEIERTGATAVLRALPLHPRGVAAGAVLLVRDVTDVRRRDRALLSKDATIREIHHRVKNNLQTVASLLRLQSRRARHAEASAALAESMRRVASIAVVHEALATSVDEQVDIDDVLDRVLPMMNDVARTGGRVRTERDGRVGVLPAAMATPLVLVLTELVANALEHGFADTATPGRLVLTATRTAGRLEIVVADDGLGLPAGFALDGAPGLGLHIVRTLVDSELGGTLRVEPGEPTGTRARLTIPLAATPPATGAPETPDTTTGPAP